jgi:hypothetical protein
MTISQPNELGSYRRDRDSELRALLPSRILGPVLIVSLAVTFVCCFAELSLVAAGAFLVVNRKTWRVGVDTYPARPP